MISEFIYRSISTGILRSREAKTPRLPSTPYGTLVLFVSSLLLPALTIAGEPEMPIWITGKSCRELATEFNTICAKRGVKFNPLKTSHCHSLGDGQFRVDISRCFDQDVRKNIDSPFAHDGPNCWGGSLFFNQSLSGYTEGSSDYFAYYLESPACRRLGDTESPEAGDIIRIRGVGQEGGRDVDNHGLIYLSPNWGLSKNGILARTQNNDPILYSVQKLSEVLERYNVTQPQCRKAQNEVVSKLCLYYATYYRCIPYRDFLNDPGIFEPGTASTGSLTRNDMLQILDEVEKGETQLAPLFKDASLPITSNMIEILSTSMRIVVNNLNKEFIDSWRHMNPDTAERTKDRNADSDYFLFYELRDEALKSGKMTPFQWAILTLRERTYAFQTSCDQAIQILNGRMP